MIRLLHVLDDASDWEQRVAVDQLLSRLDAARCQQESAYVGRRTPSSRLPLHGPFTRFCSLGQWGTWCGPSLRRLMDDRDIHIVHAWGSQAALAAAAALGRSRNRAMVVSRFDPSLSRRDAKLFRTLCAEQTCALACASDTVKRRLVENGVEGHHCVVVRPGVDFSVINAAKRNSAIRRLLDVAEDERLIVASYPVRGGSGHDRVAWSGQLHAALGGRRIVVMFGDSPEGARVRRLSDRLPFRRAVRFVRGPLRYEDLLSIADVHVVAPLSDASSTSIAWAMAASVSVIGSAVYSVAELVAHRQSGYLIKPVRGPAMSVKLAIGLSHVESMQKEREFARGTAYQVFGVRRFVDQNLQLYENLLEGRPPESHITDSAIDAG